MCLFLLPLQFSATEFTSLATSTIIAGYGGSVDPHTYTITANEGYAIDTLMIEAKPIQEAHGKNTYAPETPPNAMLYVSFWYTAYYSSPENGSIKVERNGPKRDNCTAK